MKNSAIKVTIQQEQKAQYISATDMPTGSFAVIMDTKTALSIYRNNIGRLLYKEPYGGKLCFVDRKTWSDGAEYLVKLVNVNIVVEEMS